MNSKYIFKSHHLGFRNWVESDTKKLFILSSDKEVMEFFPSLLSLKETKKLIERMKNQFVKNGFCYFAVDELKTENFIGFIGIAEQNFETDFIPLDKKYWNKGYASEGAKACLKFAFEKMKLESIRAVAPKINLKSVKVMEKIGMKYSKDFKHPTLKNDKRLETCVLYKIDRNDF